MDAVVQIPQSAQLSLKENFLSILLRLAQIGAGVPDKGLDLIAENVDPDLQLLHGHRLCAVDPGQGQVFPLHQILQVLPQMLGVQQLSGKNGLLSVLVRIEGGNALLGGAELLVGQSGLFQTVQLPMPGHQQGGPVTDHQILRSDGHALGGDLLDLLPQVLRVKGNTVAQNVHDTLPENTGGQQMQGELAVLIDNGMTGVAAALITHDDVVVLGQKVNHPAFAFVTPVDSYDCSISHVQSPPYRWASRRRIISA